jgi:DnaK suppressor protein
MEQMDIIQLRQSLLQQRRELFQQLGQFESDWQTLGEREIELEEEAQKADMTSLFDGLDKRLVNQIEEIDLALCRMAAGTYGYCEECEESIAAKRLVALPSARLCLDCARKYQRKQKKLARARELLPCKGLPDDYQSFSDEEIVMEILDHLRNDGRVDLDELEISCRKGMIYLEGVIPGESEHQILLQILTDVMGFISVVDLLQVSELSWEREERAPGRDIAALSREEIKIYDVDESTEDVFESQERGIPYTTPDRPLPEKE